MTGLAGIINQQSAAPVVAGPLAITFTGETTASMQWVGLGDGSTTEYLVYQDNVLVATISDTDVDQFTAIGLTESTLYSFRVDASDGVGGVIASNSVSTTTNAASGGLRLIKDGDELRNLMTRGGPLNKQYTANYQTAGDTGVVTFFSEGGRGAGPLVAITLGRMRVQVGGAGANDDAVKWNISCTANLSNITLTFAQFDDADKRIYNISPPVQSMYSESNTAYLPTLKNGNTLVCGPSQLDGVGDKIVITSGPLTAGTPWLLDLDVFDSLVTGTEVLMLHQIEVYNA